MKMRRKTDSTPQYVVLCILFILALHIKLKSVSESTSREYRLELLRENPSATETEDKRPPAQNVDNEVGQDVMKPPVDAKMRSFTVKIKPPIQDKDLTVMDIFSNLTRKGTIPSPKVESTDCRKLFSRDEDAIEYTAFVQETKPQKVIKDESYIFPKHRCEEYITSRQYIQSSVDQQEVDFPIAFSILMFKDVVQTERLLRMVYRPQNYYCIHVDRKSPTATYDAMASIADCFDNVILASHRSDVRWGQFSVLEPELTCIRDLSRWQWKYFINLTGQEMPLRTNYQLVRILTVFNGANDVECIIKRRNKNRTKYKYINGKQTKELKDPPPFNFTLYKGAVHVTLSRGFCNYLLYDQRAIEFTEWLKDTGIPDETLFGTLNRSPQFGVPGAYLGPDQTDVRTNPYVTRFKNWGEFPCAGKKHRSVCVLSAGDLWQLVDRYDLFANKFYNDYHPVAYDCMEERYFDMVNKEMNGNKYFNTTYYEQLKFVRNHQ